MRKQSNRADHRRRESDGERIACAVTRPLCVASAAASSWAVPGAGARTQSNTGTPAGAAARSKLDV